MILKMDLTGAQCAALGEFIRSKENEVRPPDEYQFSIIIRVNGRDTPCSVAHMPVVDFLTEPRNRGAHIAVTLEIMEYVLIAKTGQAPSPLNAPVFIVPADVLTKLFGVIHRFPATAKIWDRLAPETRERVLI